MKKVLVTGVNSYVGNSFAEWVEQYPEEYDVDRISVRDDKWKEIDLSAYDSILHVAGIAHKKETKENSSLYYKVNRDLTIALAEKAKKENVKQFVFLSTMSVYGVEIGVIDENTRLNPKTYYGKSKKEAEKGIKAIETNDFKVAIIRPPMIYGKNCPGNYQRLRSLALKTPVFPDIDNRRSMIFINNLTEFLRLLILDQRHGLFCPQNKEYVNTAELVKEIAKVNQKKIMLTNIFTSLLKVTNVNTANKVFGDLIYKKRNHLNKFYNVVPNFKETIKQTEE